MFPLFDANPDYRLLQELFLRALGVIYLLAFGSLALQARGLFGSGGISPIREWVLRLRSVPGRGKYLLYPSLFWLSSSDTALLGATALGMLGSLLLTANILPSWMLLMLYLLYLSFVSLGRKFLAYQWDALLLETGVMAFFFSLAQPPSALMMAAWWLFFFRFIFSSGTVKLTSADPNWRNLRALCFHYQTQPLPNRLAWMAHQLPEPLQKASTLGTFFFELAVPFLVFGTEQMRLLAFGLSVFFQLLILSTGSYGFFNLLTLVLALPLLPPDFLRIIDIPAAVPPGGTNPIFHWVATAAFILFLLLNLFQLLRLFLPGCAPHRLMQLLAPFHISNAYGLFALMTTQRLELVIEGSGDAVRWAAYELRWKPGDPKRAPRQAAPHQPRLDWQLWFAALNPGQLEPWLLNLLRRLLEGEKSVTDFLEDNPFPEKPPKYVRVLVYRYRFTNRGEKRETGYWWHRELLARYPALKLGQDEEGNPALSSD